eukprot:3253063-Amphidinium_carterae.1
MAYKTFRKLYYNSEKFEVVDFDEKQIELLYEDGEEIHTIKIDRNATIDFKPIYAITVHKAQGMTIDKPYSIYEYKMMKSNMLYVALTRANKKNYVNFCDISVHKPKIGHIYKYSYGDKCYIGSTIDLAKRKQEHKTNPSKRFGMAIKKI